MRKFIKFAKQFILSFISGGLNGVSHEGQIAILHAKELIDSFWLTYAILV
jgi:hypothetical protein